MEFSMISSCLGWETARVEGGREGKNFLKSLNVSLSALALLTGQARSQAAQQQTHEMTVPNELIGCIIGKGGSKVAEIR